VLGVETKRKSAVSSSARLRKKLCRRFSLKTGPRGLEIGTATNYDLIVVDLMLPSMSGWTFSKAVRRERIQTPVMILTAIPGDQRVKGLDGRCRRLSPRPVCIDELLPASGLLRRGETESPGILQIDDLGADPATPRGRARRAAH